MCVSILQKYFENVIGSFLLQNFCMNIASSVRRILKRGGGGGQKLQKIWEEQKSEWKLFHPKLVRFFAQNLVQAKNCDFIRIDIW